MGIVIWGSLSKCLMGCSGLDLDANLTGKCSSCLNWCSISYITCASKI